MLATPIAARGWLDDWPYETSYHRHPHSVVPRHPQMAHRAKLIRTRLFSSCLV